MAPPDPLRFERLVHGFARLPRGLHALLTGGLVAALGASLLVIDPVPVLDEGVLLLLAAGAVRGWTERRGRPSVPAPDALRAVPGPVQRLRSEQEALTARVDALQAASRLPDGLEGELRRGLPPLLAELDAHEAFFSRRENDPWQLARARAAAPGDVALRTRDEQVRDRVAAREALIARLEALADGVRRLGVDVEAVEAGVVDAGFTVEGHPDPLLAPVGPRLRDFFAAMREVESTARTRVRA